MKEYIPHVFKQGSRQHVISLVGMTDGKAFEKCSEENCEVNKRYDEYLIKPTQTYPRINLAVENNFKYHTPKLGQPERYEAIREKAKELAYLIEETVPSSREKSLAMTNLEQTVMWANSGIARNG